MQKKEKELRSQFKYLDYARIIFLSAKTHQRVHQLFPLIQESFENSHKRVQTSVLNDVLVDAQAVNPTTTFNGGRLKIFYANQVSVCEIHSDLKELLFILFAEKEISSAFFVDI